MMPKGLVKGIGKINSPEEVARAMMEGWMKSPGHRKNILLSDYTHIGIAIIYNHKRKRYFGTQVFKGCFEIYLYRYTK